MKKQIPMAFLWYFGLLLLMSGLITQSAFAQGKMLLKPHIEAGWQSDSNFHKSETNEQSVYTYNVKPGLEFGYFTDKSLITLDYWFNVLRYDDRDDVLAGQKKADEFDYTEHRGFFTAQTQATDRLLIGIDNLFWKTRDPANADANSNAVDRFKYTLNNFTPHLTYKFGDKFGLGLKYTNLITDYQDDGPGQGEDSNENRGTLTFYYYFSPKTSFDLDYQYWERDYDKTTSDYTSNQVMGNVNQQFNYFTFTGGAGYHKRDFDQTLPSGDMDRFVWKLSVTGQNPPDAVGIPRSSMYISIGSNLNDSGSGETYYNATRIDARFTHLFVEKINCTIDAWYQNSDYKTSDREDDRWFISGAVDYLINDFISAGIEGGLEQRDSNESGRDFDNQFIMLNVRFYYNMGSK